MKHGSNDPAHVSRATSNPIEPDVLATWLGVGLDTRQQQLLEGYADWLITEALQAGGIGPGEADRIWDRHVLDSLAYARALPADTASVVDIGSGVGLPGIPVAIARPETQVTIVDRAERRTRLAKRAIRILKLENVDVITADVASLDHRYAATLFRASLTVEAAAARVPDIVAPGGLALFGLSRGDHVPETAVPPEGLSFTVSDESGQVLDSPFWLLTMRVAE